MGDNLLGQTFQTHIPVGLEGVGAVPRCAACSTFR